MRLHHVVSIYLSGVIQYTIAVLVDYCLKTPKLDFSHFLVFLWPNLWNIHGAEFIPKVPFKTFHLCINFRVTKLLIWAITKHILIELYLKLFLQPQFGLSRGHFPKSVRNTLSPPYVNVRILEVMQPLLLGIFGQFLLFWNPHI